MRIWSLHPSHLDRAALVACWRETLLAQAVLAGRTKGYQRHPQLERFRAQSDPLAAVGAYLRGVADEADARGYRFDRSRIDFPDAGVDPIPLTDGQIALEWAHLGAKLMQRSPDDAARWREESPSPHPAFTMVPGQVESWERRIRGDRGGGALGARVRHRRAPTSGGRSSLAVAARAAAPTLRSGSELESE